MMKYDDVEDRFKEMKRFHRTKWMNGYNGMTKQWSLEFDCCSFCSCLDIICVFDAPLEWSGIEINRQVPHLSINWSDLKISSY